MAIDSDYLTQALTFTLYGDPDYFKEWGHKSRESGIFSCLPKWGTYFKMTCLEIVD